MSVTSDRDARRSDWYEEVQGSKTTEVSQNINNNRRSTRSISYITKH